MRSIPTFQLPSNMISRSNTQPHPRIFLAVDVPSHVRMALLSLTTVQIPAARLIADDSYHITLHFLGNTPIAPVARVAQRIRASSFDAKLSSLGAFPNKGRPYTLFARVRSTGIIDLQQRLATALQDAGFQPDQRFYQPHVTLAKVPPRRNDSLHAAKIFLDENDDFCTDPFRVNEFVLMESTFGPRGEPYYIIRDRFPLEPEEQDNVVIPG